MFRRKENRTARELFTRVADVSGRAVLQLKVRSALNPTLWLCGIVTLPAAGLATVVNGSLQVALIALAFIPVVLFGLSEIYLLVRDPDKLQSEDYQIRKRALDLIEQKGGAIPIEVTSIETIAKPEFVRLSQPRTEDQ